MNDSNAHLDPPSPCIGICTLDRAGQVCIACLRTIDEIAGWRALSPLQKRATLDRIAREKDELKPDREG